MNDLDFYKWIIIKDKINAKTKLRLFKERDIWWCNCGKNVGVEINGKNDLFLRPFIVFKKFNQYCFLGIPLTSKEHHGPWYRKFIFNSKVEYAVLLQSRFLSSQRLHKRIGMLSTGDYTKIQNGFLNLYS